MKLSKYRDYKVQNKEYNLVWLDKLLLLLDSAKQEMVKPHVLHIRFKLADGVKLRKVTDRLDKHLTTSKARGAEDSRYRNAKPKCLWKKEVNHDQDGLHYHLAIVIDQWKVNSPYWTLYTYFHKMRDEGLINDFSILKAVLGSRLDAVTGKEVESLPLKDKDRDNTAKAVYWLSYLAKTETALLGEKCCWLTGV